MGGTYRTAARGDRPRGGAVRGRGPAVVTDRPVIFFLPPRAGGGKERAVPRPANPAAHEALLEAARAEFAREGLERARVEDIARRAGVSKGAFYLHFRSKDDAFREILQRFLGALEEQARRRQEAEGCFERDEASRPGAGEDLARRIEFEARADGELLELLWRNRQIVAALDGAGGKAYARVLSDFRRRMRETVIARIRERQRAGRVRPDVDPEVVGHVVLGAYEDFGRRMAELKERPDLAAWSRALLVILYRGVVPPPPRTMTRRSQPSRSVP
jgi:AcrR family transcriptional regulator